MSNDAKDVVVDPVTIQADIETFIKAFQGAGLGNPSGSLTTYTNDIMPNEQIGIVTESLDNGE